LSPSPQFYTPRSPDPDDLQNDDNWDDVGEYTDGPEDDEEDELIRPIPATAPPTSDFQENYY